MDIEPKLESAKRAVGSFSERLRSSVENLTNRRNPDGVRARDLVPAISSFLDGQLPTKKLAEIQGSLSELRLAGVLSVSRSVKMLQYNIVG